MCFSLTSTLQSRLHRRGIDVVRQDRPQSPLYAPLLHLSNAERAFHQEFDITQNRYNPRTGAFERVPEWRPIQIVLPRKQRRASWFSSGNMDRRGGRGTGIGPSTRRPSQNPRRHDYHTEDVEDLQWYREEQAQQNARQNQSHRQSRVQNHQYHPYRRTSVTCSPDSSSNENINIENRSLHARPSTKRAYRSPPPSSPRRSPPFPCQGDKHEEDDADVDWEENTARSRKSVQFAGFDESRSGRTYDGADLLERTPRAGR